MTFADLLILNGKVLTVDKNFSIKEAIAVKNGLIIDVGDSDSIRRLAGPRTEVIDLEGKMILPGAHDAHVHAANMGVLLNPMCLNLFYPNIKSLKDLKEKVAEKVKSTPPGTWIMGIGWSAVLMEEFGGDPTKTVTRYDLDDVSPDHPVFLYHNSLHMLVANSKAMELSGITKHTPDAKGIVRDHTGEPTGIFEESVGENLITKNVPPLSYEELKKSIGYCQEELNKNGYTSFADAGLGVGGSYQMCDMWGHRVIDVYQQMSKAKELTCRASIGVFPFSGGLQSYETLLKGLEKTELPKDNDPNWVRFWLKIWLDGMPENATVWMWQKQDAFGSHGTSLFPGETDDEQYEDFLKTVKHLHRDGWQIGVHVMGDRSVDKCIDAYVSAMEEFPRNRPRHYIIHGELTTPEKAKKAAKYDIGFSVQPTDDAYLYYIYENLNLKWGKNLTSDDMSAFKMLIDYGVNVAGGSDAPVTFPNWRKSVQDAVIRRSPVNEKIYGAEHAVTIEDGIRMFTINGAIQEKMEHIRGSIEIGKVADFQVLGEDIFAVNKEEIGQIPVVMTISDGKIVYSA